MQYQNSTQNGSKNDGNELAVNPLNLHIVTQTTLQSRNTLFSCFMHFVLQIKSKWRHRNLGKDGQTPTKKHKPKSNYFYKPETSRQKRNFFSFLEKSLPWSLYEDWCFIYHFISWLILMNFEIVLLNHYIYQSMQQNVWI